MKTIVPIPEKKIVVVGGIRSAAAPGTSRRTSRRRAACRCRWCGASPVAPRGSRPPWGQGGGRHRGQSKADVSSPFQSLDRGRYRPMSGFPWRPPLLPSRLPQLLPRRLQPPPPAHGALPRVISGARPGGQPAPALRPSAASTHIAAQSVQAAPAGRAIGPAFARDVLPERDLRAVRWHRRAPGSVACFPFVAAWHRGVTALRRAYGVTAGSNVPRGQDLGLWRTNATRLNITAEVVLAHRGSTQPGLPSA